MKSSSQLQGELRTSLKDIMNREIATMREMLSSLQMEQEIHLRNATDKLRPLLNQRQDITSALSDLREKRLKVLGRLAVSSGKQWSPEASLCEESCIAMVLEHAGPDSCEIVLLRDQMLALLDQLKSYTERNNYLMAHKIEQTKQLMHTLGPKPKNPTYGQSGTVTVKTATLPMLNQEV